MTEQLRRRTPAARGLRRPVAAAHQHLPHGTRGDEDTVSPSSPCCRLRGIAMETKGRQACREVVRARKRLATGENRVDELLGAGIVQMHPEVKLFMQVRTLGHIFEVGPRHPGHILELRLAQPVHTQVTESREDGRGVAFETELCCGRLEILQRNVILVVDVDPFPRQLHVQAACVPEHVHEGLQIVRLVVREVGKRERLVAVGSHGTPNGFYLHPREQLADGVHEIVLAHPASATHVEVHAPRLQQVSSKLQELRDQARQRRASPLALSLVVGISRLALEELELLQKNEIASPVLQPVFLLSPSQAKLLDFFEDRRCVAIELEDPADVHEILAPRCAPLVETQNVFGTAGVFEQLFEVPPCVA
mmetsp:Transcript_73609/g.204591  ORF Transcript_73609/g.204591 Transcript_73609/m.204591 type:complete len:364 (-) Transcript_73609:1295-2386(-)